MAAMGDEQEEYLTYVHTHKCMPACQHDVMMMARHDFLSTELRV
jgi:hypothetical protein